MLVTILALQWAMAIHVALVPMKAGPAIYISLYNTPQPSVQASNERTPNAVTQCRSPGSQPRLLLAPLLLSLQSNAESGEMAPIVDPATRKAGLQVRSAADTTAYRPYRNQTVMILTTSKDGREVVDNTEVVNSKGRLKPER
ncbi:uncharacterized protein PG998_013206 [Apiospora kogelbergensis]|uniref:uncharacterized protein n=1 Tax=Apiospora kogelbergensis TaxID=1337665 RepID=UPI003131687A